MAKCGQGEKARSHAASAATRASPSQNSMHANMMQSRPLAAMQGRSLMPACSKPYHHARHSSRLHAIDDGPSTSDQARISASITVCGLAGTRWEQGSKGHRADVSAPLLRPQAKDRLALLQQLKNRSQEALLQELGQPTAQPAAAVPTPQPGGTHRMIDERVGGSGRVGRVGICCRVHCAASKAK